MTCDRCFKSQKAHALVTVFKPIFPPTKNKQLIFDVVILQNLAGMEAFTRPDAQIWLSPAESQQLRQWDKTHNNKEQWPVGSPGDFCCIIQRIMFPIQVVIKRLLHKAMNLFMWSLEAAPIRMIHAFMTGFTWVISVRFQDAKLKMDLGIDWRQRSALWDQYPEVRRCFFV